MGGENSLSHTKNLDIFGSSPRGRGKRKLRLKFCPIRGLIPAWAGKTQQVQDTLSLSRAHPRVGGENPAPQGGSGLQGGSSPRGRGKLRAARDARPPRGLIPAWAGKTKLKRCPMALSTAHPRVGGENPKRAGPARRRSGSSPRGRGKHYLAIAIVVKAGLIPAWAGKTCWFRHP